MIPWTGAIYDFPDDQDASLAALLSALSLAMRTCSWRRRMVVVTPSTP